VSDGQEVEADDTVGFVGNTGNARTTPPHLHLGLYRRGEGAVDPFPFIDPVRTTAPPLAVDTGRLGEWNRVRNPGVRLRAAPGSRGDVVRELDRHTPLRVLAGSGSFFRARLPDGTTGYVAARLTEPAAAPFSTETVAAARAVLAAPTDDSGVLARLEAGTEVPVLGRFGDYLYVRTAGGRAGWLGLETAVAGSVSGINPRTMSGRASQPGASR
jgi:SH3-like domain-containing protein